MNGLTVLTPRGLRHASGRRRSAIAAICVTVLALRAVDALAQEDPGYASAGVTIGFAPSGGDSLGRGVTIGFQTEGGDSLSRGVTIAFQNATTTANNGAAITIGFALPVNPSTQLGKARNSAFNADPVNTATGNYVFDHTDLSMPGRGMGLAFSRFYNSLDATSGSLGPGWTHSYNVNLTVNADQSVQVRWGDGHVDYYDKSGSSYVTRYPGVFDKLSAGGDGTFTVLQKSQTRWHFTTAGRLDTITDRNGNAVALSYDGIGRLASVQEPGGRSLSLNYDGAGRITAITDPLPRTVAFAYGGSGQLQSVTDVDGGVESYTYDNNQQLVTATDPRGFIYLTNTYDANKRVVTWQADANGNSFQFDYDPATGQTTITDPLGHSSVDAHDVLNRLIRQTDRLGHSVSYTYDTQNNRTSVTDQNGHSTTYTYDVVGNVVGKVDALNQTTAITYDALNSPLTRTDEAKGITRFTYDSHGNLLTTADPLGHVSTMTYDTHGQALTLTDANGGVVSNTYDAAGNLVSVTDPAGAATTFAFDAVGRKRSVTDARTNKTEFSYDGSGRILTTRDALGHVIANVYDANGNRTRTTDARGGITAFTYDKNNLLTTMTDPSGGVTRHTYDALDRRLTTTDALNKVTAFTYDVEGRVTQTTLPTGGVTQVAHDGVGNKTAVTDPNGHTTQFTYDALNRLVATTDALGHATQQGYDPLGHVTKSTDAAGRITTFAYDAAGHLIQVTDPAGGTARYTYDLVGNRLTVTDPNSQTTTLTYDAANRLKTSRDPLGRITSNTYDAVGNRATVTDAKGVTLSYTYDAVNRLTMIQPPAGGATTFSYDAGGNRTALADSIGTTTYTFDALNRLAHYVDAYGQAIGYEYDAIGNRTALVYPDGKRVTYAFDGSQRLTRVTDWGGRVTQYGYDAAGQLTNTTNPNGTTVAASYDNADRLTSLADLRGDASVLASYAYTLDPVGNRTAVVQQEPLLAVPASALVPYTYNAANQIQTAGGSTFAFDLNGNLTSRAAPTATTAYTWDVQDRLTQVNDGATASQFVYNGVGTRLARTVNGVTTRFVVDPQPALSQLLVETDASGSVIARYVYGLGLVARVDAAGAVLTYHFDPRGSTVAMTNTPQVVVNSYAYDEFGVVRQKQEAVAQPFQYIGQFGVTQDPNGLLFMRARYYAPAEGRFLSVDPWSSAGGSQSLHRYVYALNSPTMLIDPSGYFGWRNIGTIAVGVTQIAQGLSSLITDAAVITYTGALSGGWTGAKAVVDYAGVINESSKQFSAAVQNLRGGANYVLAEDFQTPIDEFIEKHPTVKLGVDSYKAIDAVIGLYDFGNGRALSDVREQLSYDHLPVGALVNIYDSLRSTLDVPKDTQELLEIIRRRTTDAYDQFVIVREQREVQRPVSSTKKKSKRDTGR